MTYSKGIQTSSTGVGTSTDLPLEDDDETRPRDGGNGRETEDEMRKRILEELEVERSALEKELREIKEKEEKLAGECLTSAKAPFGSAACLST